MPYNILCLSHLAWQRTLFQRPQQLMSRLAERGHSVVYAGCVGVKSWWNLREGDGENRAGANRIRILHLPSAPTARTLSGVRNLFARSELRRAVSRFPSAQTVLWLYHPALLTLGRSLLPDAPVVYDVMDRFPAFSSSASDVENQEELTLRTAAVLFTGGRSLDNTIRRLTERVRPGLQSHCFASGIDLDHFALAGRSGIIPPADIAALPRPIYGYFGAVDERIDFSLLGKLAAAEPGASVVLIGPVLGGVPDSLPANLHLLGPRSYNVLPSYLAHFDVCLLPFRNTPLVAHVSPTKTPEYLAGGKPVVSSAIPDVVSDYGDVVRVTGNAEEFLEACRKWAVSPPDPEVLAAEARKRAMTWDEIAERMDETVSQALP